MGTDDGELRRFRRRRGWCRRALYAALGGTLLVFYHNAATVSSVAPSTPLGSNAAQPAGAKSEQPAVKQAPAAGLASQEPAARHVSATISAPVPLPPTAGTNSAAAASSSCPLDAFTAAAASAADRDASSEEGFLIYEPQFGISNQFIALHDAVIWAMLLKRTLVVPHLLAHDKTGFVRIAHGSLFDASGAARALAHKVRIVEMEPFLQKLQHQPTLAPAALITLTPRTKLLVPEMGYFEAIQLPWGRGPPHAPPREAPRGAEASFSDRDTGPPVTVHLESSAFTPKEIQARLGSCGHHRTLAFSTLFAVLDHTPLEHREFLHREGMPALLRPTLVVQSLVDHIGASIRDGSDGALGCVHIRRGDFRRDCGIYNAEGQLPKSQQRGWVTSHLKRGYSCYQEDELIALNVRQMQQRHPKLALYAAVEDDTMLHTPTLSPLNMSSLRRFDPEVFAALALPPGAAREIANAVLDQLVCASAKAFKLNAWSTFSQMVMGHIGLRHPKAIGWNRDMSEKQQRHAGVDVSFWLTEHVLNGK